MGKKDNGTKRSHNVWRHYLASFIYDEESGRVMRRDLQKKIDKPISTFNIGIENDLYRMRTPITSEDITFFLEDMHIKNMISVDRDILMDLVNYLNNDFPAFHRRYIGAKEWLNKIKKDNYTLKFERNQEDLYTFYEQGFIPIYDSLLNGEIEWYNSKIDGTERPVSGYYMNRVRSLTYFYQSHLVDIFAFLIKNDPLAAKIKLDTKGVKRQIKGSLNSIISNIDKQFPGVEFQSYDVVFKFILFMFTQYFRTSKHYNRLVDNAKAIVESKNIANVNPYSIPVLFIHYQTPAIGCRFIEHGHKLHYLENDTEIPFITSDQPIINLIPDDKVNDFPTPELYYPISPRSAIIYKPSCELPLRQKVTKEEVIGFNAQIAKKAEKYLYSEKDFDSIGC